MTVPERRALEDAAPTSAVLAWRPDADPRFVRLQAKPCPLLTRDAEGHAVCSVHAVRPLTCRSFMCGRVDVAAEPYQTDTVTGCENLTARLRESLRFREHYRTNAMQELRRWGKAMGHSWAT